MTTTTTAVPAEEAAPRDAAPASPPGGPHEAGSWREIVWIGVPMALSSGTMSIMHAVDRMMLAWDSKEALAAALPAGMLHWVLMSFFLGMIGYVNTFIAQYEGANDPRRVAASLWQAVHLAVAAGLGLLLFAPFAPAIFARMEHHPEVQPLEVDYFKALLLGSVGALASNALSCFFSGRGRTGVVLGVNVFANCVNVVLDYLFIFGWGPIPRMGAFGAGLATAVSQYAGLAAFILILVCGRDGRIYPVASTWRPDFDLFGRLVRFGTPGGVHYLLDGAAFSIFIVLVGRLGTLELAATSLVLNINFIAYSPILGLGTAVATIVGQRIGEKRPGLAIPSAWKAFAIATAYTVLCVGFFLARPDLLLAPYASDYSPEDLARIHSLVVMLLQFVAVYAFFDAMAVIFGNACRGAGDVWFLLWLNVGLGWSLMVLPTYFAAEGKQLTIERAFFFASLFIVSLGLGNMARFVSNRWQSMSVIREG